ncbi:hypothetical protein MTR67_036473, partial [Solanum verrucosum]
ELQSPFPDRLDKGNSCDLGSQLVLNLNKSRLSSIELIPLPQFMLKISTHPYVKVTIKL